MIYIKFADTKKSVDQWHVTSLVVRRKNCSEDTAIISFADDSLLNEIPLESCVEIFDGELRKFAGTVFESPSSLSGKSRKMQITAKNVWSDLERIVYQQRWTNNTIEANQIVTTQIMRSKVVLGQNCEGEKIQTQIQLADILNYAKSCGAQFDIGVIDAQSNMLLDQRTDITCAEAVLCTLRWLPNSQIYFDYTPNGLPTINIVQRKNLQCKTVNESDQFVLSFTSKARPDLKVNGVVIKYESENTSGENIWRTIEQDVYPPNVNTAAKNILVMSVELAGFQEKVRLFQPVCESIDPLNKVWWRKHIPTLKGNFLILSSERKYPELTRELISGQIPYFTGVQSMSDRIKAKILVLDESGNKGEQNISVSVMATNAKSGTYPLYTPTQLKEPMPAGMAESIYKAACEMNYQGKIKLSGLKAEEFVGKKISFNFAGGNAVTAPVIWISEDLGKCTTTVAFGPPTHLYADDIIELFRINRNRLVPTIYGALSSGNAVQQVEAFQIAESDTIQGNPSYSRLLVKVPESDWDGNDDSEASLQQYRPSIDLNPKDMLASAIEDENTTLERNAKMQRVVMVCDGKIAYAYALMSTPEKLADDTLEIV